MISVLLLDILIFYNYSKISLNNYTAPNLLIRKQDIV